MSNEAITWAYQQNASAGAKFVLVALADLADEAHSCYPGQARLARMTGQGERTVRRQLLELEVAGLVKRQRRFDNGGHRTSDRYVLPVGLKIPTGQFGHRPIKPLAKSTTGQSDLRPVTTSLPAIDDSPTGQIGQVSLREPTKEPTDVKDARARGTKLSEDWKPTAAMVAWARAEGLTDAFTKAQHPKFIDYWIAQPGAKGRKSDWPATWRNWMRNATERQPARAAPTTGAATQKALEWAAIGQMPTNYPAIGE